MKTSSYETFEMQNRDTEAANETVEPLLLPSESFTSNQKSKLLATQQNGDPEASKETTEPFALPDGFATQKSADVVFSAITVFLQHRFHPWCHEEETKGPACYKPLQHYAGSPCSCDHHPFFVSLHGYSTFLETSEEGSLFKLACSFLGYS